MAEINMEQVKKVAEVLKKLPKDEGELNFYSFEQGAKEVVASDMFPPLWHPQAINFFFFVCLHDYGFWHGDVRGYKEPLLGYVNSKKLKGSDLLWTVSKRALDRYFDIFEPENLAEITYDELLEKILFDDNGPINFPDRITRFALTRYYGQWFVERKTRPIAIVEMANEIDEPLKCFLEQTQGIDGYNKDLFQKKDLLLAMALANRPEEFLKVKDPHNWRPIIDYHWMRLALRSGMVELSEIGRETIENREWIDEFLEDAIHSATYIVGLRLMGESGCPMSSVDKKIWMARCYCSEMEEPKCSECVFSEVCEKRVELFQPIYRTTNY